ncbi:purine-cytosine permease [Physocladia obscura]|uniref:Purine-cytosine permease n=1 Tax=Physocladia obscura TaxID=109957 RepID=A0AAD5XG06_9FUNG|nr:purine-cytosine permease [Physocladia obscura]
MGDEAKIDSAEETHGESATPINVLAVEVTGINPIPTYSRVQKSAIENFTFWASCNSASTIYDVGFWDGFWTIIFFNAACSLCVALFATFGASTGLRQMVITRTMLIALINIVIQLGWSTVNVVVGGQVLNGINSNFPIWAGVLVISLLTTVISLYGYHIIHKYERYAWIPVILVFLITFGTTVHYWDTSAPSLSSPLAGILSFGASVFGFGAGWTMMAADYTVFQPADSSKFKIALFTFLGNFVPIVFLEIVGLGAASATVNKPDWNQGTAGTMIAAILNDTVGTGFAGFLLVLLGLSIIANNVPNDYSVGLSMQLIGKNLHKVNRAWWTVIGAAIYLTVSILSINTFNSVLDNFLLVIAYILGPYVAIVGAEHIVFRNRSFENYDPEIWQSPEKLPLGLAAIFSFGMGILGMFLGMAETYYTGVIALDISEPYGGDVGFELSFLFALASYLITRSIEKKLTGR